MAPERSAKNFTNAITSKAFMNQKTAYEQIITGKLHALPVPDMADAIWARIETQLDLDMPQTDPPPTNPPGTPSGGIILGGISIVFVIALITYLFFKKETNNQPTSSQPANTTNTPYQKERETFLISFRFVKNISGPFYIFSCQRSTIIFKLKNQTLIFAQALWPYSTR